MDLELITLYLNKKYLLEVAIHAEINSVLREGTIGYSTVTRSLRKQSFANVSDLAPEEPDLGRLTQLIMLFCKRLTNSLRVTSPDYQEDADSDVDSSVRFRE
jgi:hypothetical protein